MNTNRGSGVVITLVILALVIFAGAGFYAGTRKSETNLTNKSENDEGTRNVYGSATIDMSGRGLSEFPKDILRKTDTKILILSHNALRTLPAEIGALTRLEELYLDDNALEGSLPAEIRKMTNLRILDVHGNNMTGIPAEIGQLSRLEEANYADNMLDTMPNEIQNLAGTLRTIDLSGNPYSAESIAQIKMMLPQTAVLYE